MSDHIGYAAEDSKPIAAAVAAAAETSSFSQQPLSELVQTGWAADPRPPRLELLIRQEPDRGRMCGFSVVKDRRFIDPPLVLQLVCREYTQPTTLDRSTLRSPLTLDAARQTLCMISLVSADRRLECTAVANPRHKSQMQKLSKKQRAASDANDMNRFCQTIIGSTILPPLELVDVDGSVGLFFVFHDISIRVQGVYSLKCQLIELDTNRNHRAFEMLCETRARHPCAARVTDWNKEWSAAALAIRSQSQIISMRIITGDEVGLLKVVSIRVSGLKAIPSKKLASAGKKTESKPGVEGTGDQAAQQQTVQTRALGRVNRDLGIQCLVLASLDPDVVVVARANGIVEFVSLVTGESLRQHACFSHDSPGPVPAGVLPPKMTKPERFIGLHEHNKTIIACTDRGSVFSFSDAAEQSDVPTGRFTLGQDRLYRMRPHPNIPHVFATGGEKRDLCIWDLNNLAEAQPQESTDADDAEHAAPVRLLKPIWQAKNVPNDFLNLAVPIWITDIQWLSEEAHTDLATCTAYHQIRTYNTKQRKPLKDISVGENYLNALAIKADKSEFIVADTMSTMTSVEVPSGKVIGRFAGIAGAVKQIYRCVKSDIVVCISIDRKLRLFEGSKQRRLMQEVYLKQRLSAMVVEEEDEDEITDQDASGWHANGANISAGDHNNGDEEDGLWDDLEVVEEAGTSTRAGLKRDGQSKSNGTSEAHDAKRKKQKKTN